MGALTLLETQTLESDTTAGITFSDVNPTYSDLIFVGAIRSAAAILGDWFECQYGQTTVEAGTSNYSYREQQYGSDIGSSAEILGGSYVQPGILPGSSSATGVFGMFELVFYQYSNASMRTTGRGACWSLDDAAFYKWAGGHDVVQADDIWTFWHADDDLIAGSTISMYGRGTAA